MTLSPDNVLLYITDSTGRLYVLNASDGSESWVYSPPRNSDGWEISCQSGVYFGEDHITGEQFAIYAITDESPDGSMSHSTSRIVAVSHPINAELWISDSIAGRIVGTPMVTYRIDIRGKYIHTVHNVERLDGLLEGYFSVILANGTIIYTEGAGDSGEVGIYSYTAMGISHFPSQEGMLERVDNSSDLVVWATSDDEGRGPIGYLRGFEMPQNYENGQELKTTKLSDTTWNAVARPILSRDGRELFPVCSESRVRGWVDSRPFTVTESWMSQLIPTDPSDPDARK